MNEILTGDVLEVLGKLQDESVHMVVTSPPYFQLRDYEVKGQIGLERTPQEYIKKMVAVFHEIRRVLRKDGTVWLNMGDCYAGSGKGRNPNGHHSVKLSDKQASNRGSVSGRLFKLPSSGNVRGLVSSGSSRFTKIRCTVEREIGDPLHTRWLTPPEGFKPKDMMGMPWRLAFALQDDGWFLRSDIVWFKRNAMPASYKDRPTLAHEYIFLLAKARHYFYDHVAVREKATGGSHGRGKGDYSKIKYPSGWDPTTGIQAHTRRIGRYRSKQNPSFCRAVVDLTSERSLRTVWDIPTQAFPDAHFATFPEKLVEVTVLAGTSAHGCCAGCGAPYYRVTKRMYLNPGNRHGNGVKYVGKKHKPHGSPEYGERRILTLKTIGWRKRCRCKTTDRQPALVLDPFMGSGTTAVVAKQWGRSFLGIDLKPEYVEVARRRLSKPIQMKLL